MFPSLRFIISLCPNRSGCCYIYSLGVTATYLLTGKVPSGKLSWRQDVPNVTPEFADILDKSIDENLSDRYQTATEMLTAMENIKVFVYYNRAVAYHEQGEYEEAIAEFNQAIKINPEYPYAYIFTYRAAFHVGS